MEQRGWGLVLSICWLGWMFFVDGMVAQEEDWPTIANCWLSVRDWIVAISLCADCESMIPSRGWEKVRELGCLNFVFL